MYEPDDQVVPSLFRIHPRLINWMSQHEFVRYLEDIDDPMFREAAYRMALLLDDTNAEWEKAYDEGRDAGLDAAAEYNAAYEGELRKEIMEDLKEKLRTELAEESMVKDFRKTVAYFRDKLDGLEGHHRKLLAEMQKRHEEEMDVVHQRTDKKV